MTLLEVCFWWAFINVAFLLWRTAVAVVRSRK